MINRIDVLADLLYEKITTEDGIPVRLHLYSDFDKEHYEKIKAMIAEYVNLTHGQPLISRKAVAAISYLYLELENQLNLMNDKYTWDAIKDPKDIEIGDAHYEIYMLWHNLMADSIM